MRRLCEWRDALGAPGAGVHSVRVANTAVFDVAATVAVAYATTRFRPRIRFVPALIGWLVVGEAAHYAFCVRTSWQVAMGAGGVDGGRK